MKTWKIVFYVSTILLSVSMLMGAYFDGTQTPEAVEIFTHLGYPTYFGVIIGVAKFLGVIGIWQNKVHFLREWAYAGFVFDLLGAVISHIAVGDGPAQYAPALINLVVVLISYISFRKAIAKK